MPITNQKPWFNWRDLVLGVLLNILVLINAFLLYDAYRIKPFVSPTVINSAAVQEPAP